MITKSSSTPGAAPEKKIAFAALHHRDYRRYFIVNLFSAMGDNIEHVISYWLLYQKFHSPVLAGFAVISHWTPFLFFAVYFGALADRHDCRQSDTSLSAHVRGRFANLGHTLSHRHHPSLARVRLVGCAWNGRRAGRAGKPTYHPRYRRP